MLQLYFYIDDFKKVDENDNDNIKITTKGREKVLDCQSVRKTEKDKAYGHFSLKLQENCKELTCPQIEQCRDLAENVIINSFSNRGLVISNQIYSGQPARYGELSDIFGFISDAATEINDLELRLAFFEAMHQFLVEPNNPQREYLASVSQGYFLYHLIGLDPSYLQIRQDIFKKTLWICDSSIIIPFVAVGCHNHEYAIELFKMLSHVGAIVFTTSNLLREAWEHFDWAVNFIKDTGAESPEFLRAALVKGNYKQNLFLDGYIRMSADGRIGSFKDYLDFILPNGQVTKLSFDMHIMNSGMGMQSINIYDLNGFVQEDWGEVEEARVNIQSEREKRGIYRSQRQVESEAEVGIIVKNLMKKKYTINDLDNPEKVYFVSQSRIIDYALSSEDITTWTPEALYRYISALPGNELNSDLLQQCMLHEYYYAGISFIDSDRYRRFFGPSIDAAKILFEKEKSKYVDEIEEEYTKDIDEEFAKTPDLEKPFFVAQMGWRHAEKAEEREKSAKKLAFEAEEKNRKLESEKSKAWKKKDKETREQQAAMLRNMQDPKHLRKRHRQAKKRKKNK